MDTERKALRDKARSLRKQGLSLNEIARKSVVHPSTVGRWVQDIDLTDEVVGRLKAEYAAQPLSKDERRLEARRLRREHGLSLKEICVILGVSKSSASVWVRDIQLSETQIARLQDKQKAFQNQLRGAQGVRRKHEQLRRRYQAEGRETARENNHLHMAGCMLYWAEGRKRRNSLELTNSDPDMLQFYMRFLRESLGVEDGQIRLEINCYVNNGISESQIAQFWLEKLQLTQHCLVKTQVNKQPTSSRQQGRKLLYGVCTISVHNTRLVMHVLGAIQEYAGIDKTEWLM